MSNPHGPPGWEQLWGNQPWDSSRGPNQPPAYPQSGYPRPAYPQWGAQVPAPQQGYPQPAYQQWGQPPAQPGQPYGGAPLGAHGSVGHSRPGAQEHGFTQPGHPPPGAHGGYSPAPYGFGPQQPDTVTGPGAPGRRRKAPWPWLLGGLGVVVVLVVLFLGFVAPGWFYRTVFDAGAVEQGVERILVDSYGIDGVTSVSCPSGQAVDKGASFACQVMIGGRTKSVEITIRNSEGSYEVSRPR